MTFAMGQYDAPQNQEQPVFYLDLYKSNVAVFGSPMSGKTTFIKTLLVRLHEDPDRLPEENIYLIDFGGTIGDYGKLRNVCACFDNSNEENIKRIFKTLDRRLEENARMLDNRSYYQVVTKTPEKAPPHLLLIIENLNSFIADERYEAYQERLMRFCRDGLSKGLTVIITANDTSGISRYLSNMGQKIAFSMPNELYYEIFGSKIGQPMKLPGRAVVNIGSEVYECQCFLPFPDQDDEPHIDELVRITSSKPNPNRMVSFADVLTRENYGQYCADGGASLDAGPNLITVGLDYYEHLPVTVNITESRSIAIYGKRQFGKTNLLAVLLEGVRRCRPEARFIYLDDGRRQLLPFYQDGPEKISEEAVYFNNVAALKDYMAENGYGGKRKDGKPSEPAVTPFTVFVLQAKMLYRSSSDAKNMMAHQFPMMIAEADEKDYLFIFSDVAGFSDMEIRTPFNSGISLAFLLDNIGEFVSEGGSKSVFEEMNAKELKAEYAKCALGDGYVYDIERDVLQKLKFIKH